jgi:mono/diheme cytochrome c family protein
MANQPSYKPLEPSAFFGDGRSARPLVPGTVARGHLRSDTGMFSGLHRSPDREALAAALVAAAAGRNVLSTLSLASLEDNPVDAFPFPVTAEVMERGRERYMIFCVVCHDPLGTGRGKIVERGYTAPPTFHQERLRKAPVGHFYEVITNGYGSMPEYAPQIPPRDRWAIVAYIRALQLSQYAPLSELPPEDRARIPRGGPRR